MKPRRILLWAAPALALLAALLLLAGREATAPAPLSSPSRELKEAAEGLDEVWIEAEFLPESRSLRVVQRMTLVSRASRERDGLTLRAYPNAFQSMETSPLNLEELYDEAYPGGFSSGALVMEEASAALGDDELRKTLYRYTDEAKTVLSLPLPESWNPGERLTVSLRYTLTLPAARSPYGVYDGVYTLGAAFLLPAVYEDGAWREDEYGPIGDPLAGECRNFTLKLTLPQGYACAAGAQGELQEDGTLLFRGLAMRDFALTLSRDFQSAWTREGDVVLVACAREKSLTGRLLETGRKALALYQELYGAYPYPSLTIAAIPLPYDETAYPGLCLLGDELEGETLEKALAHAVARQWWRALVGSDSLRQPWQTEALCRFSALNYWGRCHGEAARESWLQEEMFPSLRVTLSATAGAPVSWFASLGEYCILVRDRAAVLLDALDEWMDGGLNDALRLYRERYAFRVASREDFVALLQEFSGQDPAPLIADYLDTVVSP